MSAPQPLPWTTESAVRRRHEIASQLVGDGEWFLRDAAVLFDPPLPREDARAILLNAVEAHAEARALARDLRVVMAAVKSTRGHARRSMKYQALKRLEHGLKTRLAVVEESATVAFPFTFDRPRGLAAGAGFDELVGDIPDDAIDEMFPPLAGEVDA